MLHVKNGYVYTNIMSQRRDANNNMRATAQMLVLGKSMYNVMSTQLDANITKDVWIKKMLYMLTKFNAFARAAHSVTKFSYQFRADLANNNSV